MSEQLILEGQRRAISDLSLDEVVARVEALSGAAHDPHILSTRESALYEIMALHERLLDEAPDVAQRAEQVFVLTLRGEPTILENEEFRRFILANVDTSDFHSLGWATAEEVISVAEVLYAMRFDGEWSADHVARLVEAMVRDALRHFEAGGSAMRDEMFELVARAPIPPSHMDAELVRLRSRMHIYEQRRADRRKRILYGALAFQAFLVFLLFPLLFQNFENGSIQREIEASTGFEIVDGAVTCTDQVQAIDCRPPYQFLSFGDSLYWSIITYASIGYGDVTPVTPQGKTMAAIHGLMGVLTTAIVAGLVLGWITPRDLN